MERRIHMNKKEVTEIKKQLTPNNCAITRICGCYVDGEKEKKASFKVDLHKELWYDFGLAMRVLIISFQCITCIAY